MSKCRLERSRERSARRVAQGEMRLVEAAGVGPFLFTDSTELVDLGTHKTLNLLKWAGHYTRITRGRPEQCPNINGGYQTLP
jgi:hypothetical protein